MADLFSDFLEKPSGATFTALRAWLIQQVEFDYASLDLHEVAVLATDEAYPALIDRADDAMPNWLLSPSMHQYLSEAARSEGDEDRAQAEEYMMKACLAGLQGSGDGSEASPYLITHPADEYDLLESLGKEMQEQSAEGTVDRVVCSDGTELYFNTSASIPVIGSAA